jgi:hypothetical protein
MKENEKTTKILPFHEECGYKTKRILKNKKLSIVNCQLSIVNEPLKSFRASGIP